MVRFSSHDLNNKLKVSYSSHGLNNRLLLGICLISFYSIIQMPSNSPFKYRKINRYLISGQVKVCFSEISAIDCRLSDPHCNEQLDLRPFYSPPKTLVSSHCSGDLKRSLTNHQALPKFFYQHFKLNFYFFQNLRCQVNL